MRRRKRPMVVLPRKEGRIEGRIIEEEYNTGRVRGDKMHAWRGGEREQQYSTGSSRRWQTIRRDVGWTWRRHGWRTGPQSLRFQLRSATIYPIQSNPIQEDSRPWWVTNRAGRWRAGRRPAPTPRGGEGGVRQRRRKRAASRITRWDDAGFRPGNHKVR